MAIVKHWASVTWHGTGDLAGEDFVQVVSSTKGSDAVMKRAEEWRKGHLAPNAPVRIEYIGKTDPRGD